MIKNFIFDFGNVLAEFYPEKLTAPYVSDEETRKYVSEVVFDRLYWDKLDFGKITDDEVKELIRDRVPEGLKDISCKAYDNWVKNLTPVKGMQQLVYDIHKSGKKMYILSNISTGFKENYPDVEWINELFSWFDGLIFSGELGIVKPSAEIFEYVLEKFDLKREECLFVDDSEKNIKQVAELAKNAKNLSKIELLPFKKLCEQKYKELGLMFPLADTPECDTDTITKLYSLIKK